MPSFTIVTALLVLAVLAIVVVVIALSKFNAANKRIRSQGFDPANGSAVTSTSPDSDESPTEPEQPEVQPFTDISDKDAQAFIAANPTTVILDVRTPEEWAGGIIEGALMIPVQVIQGRENDVPPGPLLVVCKVGGRSAAAADYLAGCGRTDIYNLDCGMMGWTGETVMP